MDPRPLRALSRELVRELGMLSQQCGSLALSPLEAHLLIELENGPATNQQLAEQLCDGLRVRMLGEYFSIAAFQRNQLAAYVGLVEDEALGVVDIREIRHRKEVSEVMTKMMTSIYKAPFRALGV